MARVILTVATSIATALLIHATGGVSNNGAFSAHHKNTWVAQPGGRSTTRTAKIPDSVMIAVSDYQNDITATTTIPTLVPTVPLKKKGGISGRAISAASSWILSNADSVEDRHQHKSVAREDTHKSVAREDTHKSVAREDTHKSVARE
eukprot:Lankesteria_metandrocarpae@DN669_c0_g1_i1.p1